jgi:hypothetical protein
MRYTYQRMRKGSLVFLIGILLVFVPYLGIPADWKQYATVGSGAMLIFLGYFIRRQQFLRDIENESGERVTETFVETTPELFK